jgi:hypothetical protein
MSGINEPTSSIYTGFRLPARVFLNLSVLFLGRGENLRERGWGGFLAEDSDAFCVMGITVSGFSIVRVFLLSPALVATVCRLPRIIGK